MHINRQMRVNFLLALFVLLQKRGDRNERENINYLSNKS